MPGRRQHGEGSVYQRSRDGRWVAVADLGYRAGKRDRREFTGATSKIAMERRQKFLDRRRDGFTMPRGRPATVDEWMLHWLHNVARRKVEATTWHKDYRAKVEGLIVPFFTGTVLAELDEELIEDWHRHLESEPSARTGRPVSASTIGGAHRILSVALNVAVARKRISRNPASNVTPPQSEPPELLPPSEDDVLAILRECEDRRTGPRWLAGIATGMRQGEALGLLWPYADLADPAAAGVDVQWELARLPWEHGCPDPYECGGGRHVRECPVPCPKVRAAGRAHACILPGDARCCPPACRAHASSCPQRSGGPRLKRPKSAKSRRQVPLAPYAAAGLAQWRKDQKAERLAFGEGYGGWEHDPGACPRRPRLGEHVCPGCFLPARPGLLVFTQPSGRPVDSRRDWQDWSDLLEEAGVEHKRVHDGRHGVATMLLEAGMDIRVVQEIMGHSSPDFTRRTYQHVRQVLKRTAADAIERRMTGRG